MNKRTPIAIMTYNRLDTLRETINSLKLCNHVNEHDCVIFSDGSNFRKKEDKELVEEVRKYLIYIKEEGIFNSTKLIFRENNLGCKKSVIKNINYMFETYDRVIDVEDDLIVSKNFLDYMDNALDFFSDNNDIGAISAFSHPLKETIDYSEDTFMALRPCSWGFGTWANRWMNIDWEIDDYDEIGKEKMDAFSLLGCDLPDMLKRQVEENLDTWDIQWAYDMFKKKRMTVYPKRTLVRNVGRYGTHCNGIEVAQQAEFGNEEIFDFSRCKYSNRIAQEMREMVMTLEEYNNSNYNPRQKYRRYYQLLNRWMKLMEDGISIREYFKIYNENKIAIYGLGDIAKHLYSELEGCIDILYFIDKNSNDEYYKGIPIVHPDNDLLDVEAVVITPLIEYRKIKELLKNRYTDNTRLVSIEQIIF